MTIDPGHPDCVMASLRALQSNPIIRGIVERMEMLSGGNAVERIGFEPHPMSGIGFYLDVEGDTHLLRLVWTPREPFKIATKPR